MKYQASIIFPPQFFSSAAVFNSQTNLNILCEALGDNSMLNRAFFFIKKMQKKNNIGFCINNW